MGEEQSDEVFESAYELYKEIRDSRGLHLRQGNGRDDVLIEELCNSIGCPDDQIADFLKEEERSAEWLMREFLQLAAPFASMFTDIWHFLSNEQAPNATEDIRIRFGFNDDFTDVELDEFREWAETARKISIGADVAYWSGESLSELFELPKHIEIDGESGHDYANGKPYQLPVIETRHNDDFEKIVRRVRNLFQNIIDAAAKDGEKSSDLNIFEDEYEDQERSLSVNDAASILTDLLPSWKPIFKSHHEVSVENRRKTVEFFQENIQPKIEIERVLDFQKDQTPLDILQLPFWEKRWHTFEIWMTVQTLRALESYNPQVRVTDDRIPIDGRNTAIVADLERIEDHDACVVSELETPYEGEKFESIRPDLSICQTQDLDQESRKVVIEYKQRSTLSASRAEEVAHKYLSGSPEAVGVAMVNYDDKPDIDFPQAAELIGNVRPNSPAVGEYHDLVQEYMREAGLSGPLQHWAVLVDISGSMAGEYSDRGVENALLMLLELMGPSPDVYKFNDGLAQNPQISTADVTDGLGSKGGTGVEAAIEELYREYNVGENLLVVTDMNYHPPDSLPNELENMEECLPQNLSSKLDTLRESS